MVGHGKSPFHRNVKHASVYPKVQTLDPFDSDDESDHKKVQTSSKRTSSGPTMSIPKLSTNPFDDVVKGTSTFSARNKYKSDFHESDGFENQSVQELESYGVDKAEETTRAVHRALKIAEEIREDATKTIVTLHQQGEQITRTHAVAADIDHDLTRGEKLLGSLGGLFSRTWKPKKTRQIKGPITTRDNTDHKKGSHPEQREKLGLSSAPKTRNVLEPENALQKVEVEKTKQDDALSDLSNIIGELKEMAIDMSFELDSQAKALEPLDDDVVKIGDRLKGANVQAHRLLGK